ncbi:MAG: hypothetical protein IT240_08770 [Bacteroidia bacterium]|nr:hypothetical protein [Bacteroidia bacterium]MCC6769123.1 hypothetical protein [Bacteroidia bacterium]
MKRFWQGVSLLAILFYLGVGCTLIFSSFFARFIPEAYRKPLGIVISLYGFYRAARYFSNRKNKADEEESNN